MDTIESVHAAIEGGVSSIELCSNRLEGGVTPSIGFVRQAVALARSQSRRESDYTYDIHSRLHYVEVHVLIRPRAGDFVYSEAELEVILADVGAAWNAGADGVVVGFLTETREVNFRQLRAVERLIWSLEIDWIKHQTYRSSHDSSSSSSSSSTSNNGASGFSDFRAGGEKGRRMSRLQLTFHRAIDVTDDYEKCALALARQSAVLDRVLTSGGEKSDAAASKGLDNLRFMKRAMRSRGTKVVAACGVRVANAAALVRAGADVLHAGSSLHSAPRCAFHWPRGCRFQPEMHGFADPDETWNKVVASEVEALHNACRQLGATGEQDSSARDVSAGQEWAERMVTVREAFALASGLNDPRLGG